VWSAITGSRRIRMTGRGYAGTGWQESVSVGAWQDDRSALTTERLVRVVVRFRWPVTTRVTEMSAELSFGVQW